MLSVKKLFFFLILKGVFGLFWGGVWGGEGGGDGGGEKGRGGGSVLKNKLYVF